MCQSVRRGQILRSSLRNVFSTIYCSVSDKGRAHFAKVRNSASYPMGDLARISADIADIGPF